METTAVRVALRVRPLLDDATNSVENGNTCISFVKDEPQIYLGNDRFFTFDFVYPPESTQKDIYSSSILPLLDRFIEGKNVTVLAFGQTGSGKTYSMGTSLESCLDSLDQGIIHRFATSLFERTLEFEKKPSNAYQIYVSYLELYKENIHDLLVNEISNSSNYNTAATKSTNTTPCPQKESTYWDSIKEERAYTVSDLLGYLRKGSQQRTTGLTGKNTSSSKSHAIFSIILKQQFDDNDGIPTGNNSLNLEDEPTPTIIKKRLVSKFHFVDLAGFERLKTTNALGSRQNEGLYVNSGLLALENVISALSDESRRKYGNYQHIPYKDSKLTHLLQDSLGGNSHALMIACVSPSSSDYTETLNTLKYANKARSIQNHIEINYDFKEGSLEEIHHLRTQVAFLKSQLSITHDTFPTSNNSELRAIREEMELIREHSHQMSRELVEAQSQRDTLMVQQDISHNDHSSEKSIRSHPLVQQYVAELQRLKLQVTEIQSKLDGIKHSNMVSNRNNNSSLLPLSSPTAETLNSSHSFNTTSNRQPQAVSSREPLLTISATVSQSAKVSSPMGLFEDRKKLFVDELNKKNNNSSLYHMGHSISSSRRLNSSSSSSKKKPIVHRAKTISSSSSSRKKSSISMQQQRSQQSQQMDEILDLLRQEYRGNSYNSKRSLDMMFSRENNDKLTDETVLPTSPDSAMENAPTTQFEAELNNNSFPINQKIGKTDHMPISDIATPSILACSNATLVDGSDNFDDELEALAVPSWSDAPKHQSSDDSTKRMSISLDSMWGDTDSSITTSRAATASHTAHWGRHSNSTSRGAITSSKSKDIRRQNKSLLKMLHQIQADLLVKRELVGQLERTEDQYAQMRTNYEDRLKELKEHLFEIQRQRDEALKASGKTVVITTYGAGSVNKALPPRPQSVMQLRENRQASEIRSQYEVKMKRLVTENQELHRKVAQVTHVNQNTRTKSEGTIGRLCADLEALKLDKKQLSRRLKLEVEKARDSALIFERDVQQAKRREQVAVDARKKLEEANEAQNQVLKKRTEEDAAVNMQLRQLTGALRKAASEGTFLNEVTLERLIVSANLQQLSSPKPSNNSNNNNNTATTGSSVGITTKKLIINRASTPSANVIPGGRS